MRGKTKDKITMIERQSKALELRKAGKSYREIGKALGVSFQQAQKDVHHELKRLAALNLESADELRQLELERLDKALQSIIHFVEAGSPQHVMAMVRILDTRAKLLGLYAPVKTDVTFDVESMSEHERSARISELLERARARGASIALGSAIRQ
jgi:DNA-binding CsgD family transcriptional regulator